MPRFQLGQRVLIIGPIVTKYRGCEGTVIGFSPNRHMPSGFTSADKYSVRFEKGDDAEFLEIQLLATEQQKKHG
jgi:hypothetical protein